MARISAAVAALTSPSVYLLGCGGDGPGGNTTNDVDDYLVEVFGNNTDFLWGAATAAAQIEGAAKEGGKQASIWDDFCDLKPTQDTTRTIYGPPLDACGKVPKGVPKEDDYKWTTLAVTDDFYHKYEDDLDLLSDTYGMNAMRVSLSWPRIMPLNNVTGKHEKNQEGINFYLDVFKGMKDRGVTPFVTLFHWDLPNDLSWLQESVVDEFEAYADLAFDSFNEYVVDWATFNEPNSICSLGYAQGWFAPGHQGPDGSVNCGHNVLKAHAKAVKKFRDEGREGRVGIVLDYKWAYPETDSDEDKLAAEYDEDNVLGFWAEPIFLTGDYPQSLKDFYGEHMPTFTDEEKSMLNHSADFFGLNTYGGKYAKWDNRTYEDFVANFTVNGTPSQDIVERYSFSPCAGDFDISKLVDPDFECGAASGWLWAKPDAMRKYLNHVHTFYKVDSIYVTEFGVDEKGESDRTTMEAATNDHYRQTYYKRYMKEIADAKKEDNVPVKGIFAWSLMDNFEWHDGLNFRFGITYVNFSSPELTRTPKGSGKWWAQLIAKMNEATTVLTV